MAANGNHKSAFSVVPLIIDGEDVQTATTFNVTSPATGKVIHQSSSASVEDVNRAVESAQAGFKVWSSMKPMARRDLLLKAASVMEARKEELVRLQMEETGAVRFFAEFTFGLGLGFLKDFAGRVQSFEGTVPTVAQEGQSAMVIKEPYGVILGIAPWYET
jgi:acyl-CoA reductase-like NAD-dependent aldehyde dehydrogenase